METGSLHQIIKKQNIFFQSGRTKEKEFRKEQLKKLKKILQINEAKIETAVYKDLGKSKFDVFTNELALVYHDIDEAIGKLGKWTRRKRVRTNLINFPAKSYVYPEPLGTCLIIGTWNYPIQLSIAPVVAAIAAGNTVVLKPSEVAQATSKVILEILSPAFQEDFLKVVEGGAETAQELLALKWDKIFFTGSSKVGKMVYQAAAKHLTPVTLELGGKSPVFITKDCNLAIAVKRLVWGKFLNAGQTCIAPDYVLVDKEIEKQFLHQLKERIQEMDYSPGNKDYVRIINSKHYNRLQDLIQKEKVYYRGESNSSLQSCAPVVLHDIEFTDPIMEEEIFGPILPVLSYTNLKTAIEQVKSLPAPLSCYVFTNNKQVKKEIIHQISFGGGAINDTIMHITNSNLPFGGVGNSGIGNYHGKAGFATFTHYKSILEKATWLDPKIKYPPYSTKKLKWIKRLFGV